MRATRTFVTTLALLSLILFPLVQTVGAFPDDPSDVLACPLALWGPERDLGLDYGSFTVFYLWNDPNDDDCMYAVVYATQTQSDPTVYEVWAVGGHPDVT